MGKFLFSVVLFLAVPSLALAECSGPQPLASEVKSNPSAALYVELGNWFINRDQSSCAVEAFRAGIRLVPDSADLWYLLALALDSGGGDPKDAVAPLQQAIRIEPRAFEFHLLLGNVYNQLHQKKQAMLAFEHALAIDRHSTTVLDALSKLLVEQGRYRDAIKLLKSAPPDESLTLNLAQAYRKAHMSQQAVKVLLPAVRQNPSSAPLAAELVNVYLDQKRYPDAAQLGEKFFRLHPDAPEAEEIYLQALVLNRDVDKARTFSQMLLAKRPQDFKVVYWSGLLERETGKYEIARVFLEDAIRLNPNDSNAYYNLGIVLSEIGDYAGAEKQLQKSLTLCAGSNEPQVRYRLASVLRAMGETEQARKQFKLTEEELQANGSKKLAYPMQGC